MGHGCPEFTGEKTMLTDALEVYVIGMFLICILLLLYFIGEYFKW